MNRNNNSRSLGFKREAQAAAFLQHNGAVILETNYSCRFGEIDIIAIHKGYLAFLEVKYRKSFDSGTPEAAVDFIKQKKICRAADCYRIANNYHNDTPFRYDVIAISDNYIRWYQNAFEHIFIKKKRYYW